MSNKSIAQIFSPNQEYVPTKCSVYLRPIGTSSSSFDIDGSPIVIDAANFKKVTQTEESIVISEISGFTGSAVIKKIGGSTLANGDGPSVSYPIRSTTPGKHYLYLRIYDSGTIYVKINGYTVNTVVDVTSGWNWVTTTIIIPDDKIQSLELEFSTDTQLDKIIISKETVASPDSLDYTLSPFVTVHGRLATVSSGLPQTFQNQAWSINTYDDLKKEGWYNFDLTILEGANPTDDDLAFVLLTSGTSALRYVIWDTAEKATNPIAMYTDDDVWVSSDSTSMSFKLYADYDCLDEVNCIINTPDATLESKEINDFSDEDLHPKHSNTEQTDDIIAVEPAGNDVILDVNEKVMTLVIDQSGSMSWNDSSGVRHQLVVGIVDALDARYPSDVRFNLLKLNAEPAFSFFIPLSTKVESNNVSDIIRESFKDKPDNFAGFRVVRNPSHYPETPIDGEIIQNGYALAALDIDLEQNKQYYYTVYTYDQFDRFSDGIDIPVKTNVIDVPRGIPTFSVDVQIGLDETRNENIVGMWNTDEGNGDFTYDFSDTNTALALTNTRWIGEYDCPTGRFGLRFNGVSSQADSGITQTYNFESNAGKTISFWIMPFDDTYSRSVICCHDGNNALWSIGTEGTSVVYTFGSSKYKAGDLPLEEWSHVSVSQNSGGCTLYVNGVSQNMPSAGSVSYSAINANNTRISIGGKPITSAYDRRFFGKLSHIHIRDVLVNSSEALEIATPKQRYSELGDEPARILPDNGDRLVMVSFEIPEDYNYETIRVVRNHSRMPLYEADGDIVLEVSPTVGKNSYGLPYDYDVDSDYWFRIFTLNSLGNWCPIEDAVGQLIHIPDQDRPHIVISCGPQCVVEISPGPSYGSCSAPNIEIGRGGNEKVHIRWTVPTDDNCTLVKIFHSNKKFVTYDNRTDWIVESDSFPGDHATPIFTGPSSIGEYVHRNVSNKQTGFYTVVFTDRLGRHSSLVSFTAVPLATADDSGIPLLEAMDVAYHIDDYDRIRITWKSPFTISSSNEGWFDDRFYFYGAICNLYGQPLEIDYPDNVKITTAIGNVIQSTVENVFESTQTLNTPESIPNATFSVNSGGLISGVIRLRSSPLFATLKSLSIGISAEYSYSNSFKWNMPSSTVKFKTPLEMRLVNRDSSYLNTGDFTHPACENDLESGGSDLEKSGYKLRVNGAWIRRKAPFVARAIFTYKGLPLRQANISVRLLDAIGGPCGISVKSLTTSSKTLKFAETTFPIQLATIPVLDANNNPTGVEEVTSYADIPMVVPNLPQSARLYVRVKSQAFQSVARMNIFYPSTLRMALSATAPKGDGADVKEQFARAWFIDPDYPNDESKIQVVPNLSIVKWILTKDGSTVRKVPFYSTDTVPLANGVFSYTRSGTARFVYFGPAKTGSEGSYKLVASTTVSGLSSSVEATLEIKAPGGSGYQNYIPDPELPRIFCEMDECINYLWADGEDYAKMRIFRNPSDSTKTLVPDEINGGYKQAKYADKFRECSVDEDGNDVMFPLPVGTVVNVSAPGYEIIWGSVTEIVNEEAGTKKLNTEGAFNALDSADITLGRETYYNVYFRKNSVVEPVGCRDVSANNCCGFDMANRICNDPHDIGSDTGVIVSTKINISGKPVVIFGGGPIGDDNVSRPPCVLVPREPLFFKLVGIFVNNNIVEEVVVDGETVNKFIFEIKYDGRPVSSGVPIDVLLVVNINGEDVTKIGDFDIYTYFGVPKTIYTYTSTEYPGSSLTGQFSFASLTLNPIPTDKNIAIGVGVSTTYDGKIVTQTSSSSSGGS